jgi:hypothetical protein
MSEKQKPEARGPAQIETVRCLSCGATYAKPSRGGTVGANPGCPECEYVGWVLVPDLTRLEPPRSSADRPRTRSA